MGKRLKVTGLALLAIFAIGVVSASAAQAAVHWNVEGKALSEGSSEAGAETVELTKFGTETSAALTMTVPNFLRIRCSGWDIIKGAVIGTKKGSTTAFRFTSCVVLTSKGEATKCTVKNSGGTVGTIEGGGTTSELKEVSGSAYDVFTPSSGGTFTTLVIGAMEGSSCALSGTNVITGTVALKLKTGTNETKVEGEGSQAIGEAAGAKILYGTREAFLDGKGDLALASGKKWGVGF